MANAIKTSANEQWESVECLLEKWLKERQQLITRYWRVSNRIGHKKEISLIKRKLHNFGQVMVDYVSAGHFEVYEAIFKEAYEFKDSNCSIVQKFYEKIQHSTETCLSFNDKIDELQLNEDALEQLYSELSQLGESIELRFEYEDKLIDQLHVKHKSLVA